MPRCTILFHDLGAGHVGRHQVRCELDSTERKIQRLGQRADHQRLCQTRHAFQQHVTAAEQTNQDLVDDFFLADDDLAQLFHHSPASVMKQVEVRFANGSRFRFRCIHPGCLSQVLFVQRSRGDDHAANRTSTSYQGSPPDSARVDRSIMPGSVVTGDDHGASSVSDG